MKRLTILLSLVIGLGNSFVAADEFAVVAPASVGFNAEKLTEIGDAMQAHVDEKRMIGGLALIARNDKVAYLETWGQSDGEAGKPMTADAIFRIYSMSKPITSVAVMMLVEQGKLELDAPVSKYLPELRDVPVLTVAKSDNGDEAFEAVAAKREMTVRDLLRHTSGLTYGFFGNSEIDKRYQRAGVLVTDRTIAETITKLSKIPLRHQPGTRFEYSVSTDVLGRLVEVASGQPFDRFLAEHIFEPLDMNDTFFSVPKEKQPRLAQMYSPTARGGLRPAAASRSRRFVNETKFFSGGGGLCSTTRDYFRFCQMLLDEGELEGTRILKPETVREMITNQLGEEVERRPGFQFGLGFSITPEGEFSWGGAAGTRFWIHPKKKVIGIFMVQINPYRGEDFGRQVKRLGYAALQDDVPELP